MKVSIDDLLARLQLASAPNSAAEALAHGTMSLKVIAAREAKDHPSHAQDSVHIVVSGTAGLALDGQSMTLKVGDAVFVRAGQEHRFEARTDDFVAWAFFWGPDGGEEPSPEISVFASVDA